MKKLLYFVSFVGQVCLLSYTLYVYYLLVKYNVNVGDETINKICKFLILSSASIFTLLIINIVAYFILPKRKKRRPT